MLRRSVLCAGVVLVLSSIALTASAQGPFGGGFGRGGGGGGSSSMLLIIPEVQKELNITDSQKKEIETIATDVREKAMATFGQINFQEIQNLSQEERDKKFAEMRTKFEGVTKEVDVKVAKILDEKQVARLKELQLQREGGAALSRPEVIKKLEITDEQQAKMKKIQEDARPKGGPGGGFDPNQSQEERRASFQKMRDGMDKAQKDTLAVLTDEQMIAWTEMCGKTFKFPQGGGRGGFGGPGGRGGPGGPGGTPPGQ